MIQLYVFIKEMRVASVHRDQQLYNYISITSAKAWFGNRNTTGKKADIISVKSSYDIMSVYLKTMVFITRDLQKDLPFTTGLINEACSARGR